MKKHIALSILTLTLGTSTAFASRPFDFLCETTFGMMTAPVMKNSHYQLLKSWLPYEPVVQKFSLKQLFEAQYVTVIDMDKTTLMDLVPVLRSLRDHQPPEGAIVDSYEQMVFRPDEYLYSKELEDKVKRGDSLNGYTVNQQSLNYKTIIPVNMRTNASTAFDKIRWFTQSLVYKNVIFMHIDYQPSKDDKHQWLKRKRPATHDTPSIRLYVMNSGSIVLSSFLAHGTDDLPGEDALTRGLIDLARQDKTLDAPINLTHNGIKDAPAPPDGIVVPSRAFYRYSHTDFRAGDLLMGTIDKDIKYWNVDFKGGSSYKF